MGMFDNLRCEVPLPDGWVHPEFQTKDFDCELALYRITADGRLEVERFELVPDGPPGQHPFFKDWIDWQKQKRVNERWEAVPFHGDCHFYSYSGDINGPDGVDWHEYRARFTEGRLTSLIAHGRHEPDPAESPSPQSEAKPRAGNPATDDLNTSSTSNPTDARFSETAKAAEMKSEGASRHSTGGGA